MVISWRVKSCGICLHINLPSGMCCSPYRWLHTEFFFCFPTLFSISLIHCVIVFLLPVAVILQPAIFITLVLFLLRYVVKDMIQLELLQLQNSPVKIFQDRQVLQFTMAITIDQLTATGFLYDIEHSCTLV